ncbi:hypothetical protein ACLMJK_000796 [Lecanora helva]
MASRDIYADRLGRHAIEAKRLDEQFRIITEALGWLLHPLVANNLGEAPRIADFATGTGLFLLLLSELYPGARLDSYDISSAMFLSDKNVQLSVAKAKDPLPANLHGVYDVIHIRFLSVAMEPDDWKLVLRNMVPLLKPGGVIQWTEPDFSTVQYLGGEPDSTTSTMTKLSLMFRSGGLQQRFSHGWSTLPTIMERCGLRVERDVVSSDRVVASRRVLTENALVAMLGFARMLAAKQTMESGQPELTASQIETMKASAMKEIESGCYVRYDVHTAIGFKP